MLRANDDCWCGSGKKYKRCHKTMLLRAGAVGPERAVPSEIARPDYVATGTPRRATESMVKAPDVVERMRAAGKIARDVLAETGAAVAVGVTTDELDRVAHEAHVARGVYPSPLRYRGFPKSVCTSVNEVICHGIPDDTVLEDGDLVNLDVTAYLDGYHGDLNRTFLVGEASEEATLLVERTEQALARGIRAVAPGRQVNVIGRAIEAYAKRFGYGVVRDYTGHGVGRAFHTGLVIPHYDAPEFDTVMEPGMVFTIEPMLTLGTIEWDVWDDDWTVVTRDRALTAQFEHTLVVTERGAEILTLP